MRTTRQRSSQYTSLYQGQRHTVVPSALYLTLADSSTLSQCDLIRGNAPRQHAGAQLHTHTNCLSTAYVRVSTVSMPGSPSVMVPWRPPSQLSTCAHLIALPHPAAASSGENINTTSKITQSKNHRLPMNANIFHQRLSNQTGTYWRAANTRKACKPDAQCHREETHTWAHRPMRCLMLPDSNCTFFGQPFNTHNFCSTQRSAAGCCTSTMHM